MDDPNTYYFDGTDGIFRMQDVLKMFRFGFRTIGGIRVKSVLDHSRDRNGAQDFDAVEYRLTDGSSVMIKPSGTGPELEVQISVSGDSPEKAAETEAHIRADLESIIYMDYRAGYCCE